MKLFPVSIGGHIVGVALIGFVLIGYLVWVSPLNAPVTIPLILAAMLAYMGILQKTAEVKADVKEVKADQAITNKQVARSIDVSIGNQHAIAAVAVQQGQAIEAISQQVGEAIDKVDGNTATTETTHAIVNSRMDEFKQALKDISAIKEELSAAKAELAIANERAKGITEGRAQVTQEIAP